MLKRLQGQLRLNLGLPTLIQEWKGMFNPKTVGADIAAGLSVACVAIPLSLAIALASHVSPAAGLVTAIVAGIVCALFGGTRLAVSGPAAAMAVIIAANVEQYGLTGLLVIGLLCGFLQFMMGVLGLGKIIRYMPMSVITGFLAGIGAIIFIGQLPRALGLPAPDQSHVAAVLVHIKDLILETHPGALALSLSTMGITMFLPKVFPKVPASLIAIALCSVVSVMLGLDVQTIGEIPRSLPMPSFPAFPSEGLGNLFAAGLIVFALASIETLLSSAAVDKMKKGSQKHDSDQELIGQGLGNMAVAFFGGIPVTGVIARSGLNVQAGAKTRLSAIVHSITLLGAVFIFAPLMGKIPVASLAGLLLAVSLKMLNPKEFIAIWKIDRTEALIGIATFIGIVATDLLKGVQAGVLIAFIMMALRLGRASLSQHKFNDAKWHIFNLSGSLTFIALGKIEHLAAKIKEQPMNHVSLVDLSKLSGVDHTAAEAFAETMDALILSGRQVVFMGLDPDILSKFEKVGASWMKDRLIKTESEIVRFLDDKDGTFMQRLMVPGVQMFRRGKREVYGKLFEELAETQNPQALFITCSDSRINPNLITSTQPGDLFMVRNVGNVIPKFEGDSLPAEGAAIEYAVAVLGVKEIVICGHSNCGAIRTALTAPPLGHLPSLSKWIESCEYLRQMPAMEPDEAARVHVLEQIENLKTYPVVMDRIRSGEIILHAWFYRMSDLVVEEWRPSENAFVPVSQLKAPRLDNVSA